MHRNNESIECDVRKQELTMQGSSHVLIHLNIQIQERKIQQLRDKSNVPLTTSTVQSSLPCKVRMKLGRRFTSRIKAIDKAWKVWITCEHGVGSEVVIPTSQAQVIAQNLQLGIVCQ